ncbi:ATP-binding protein [Actinacidiphila acididurans]|uniref:ATP-binding protein n=1 Tax=Actinacidiphila acididurans TaxID=2784346 RepID=A0ABS2U4W2_9ACTN|nr:ATP-binding protein [Actinacidiphila acididurans]MBM9510196.1 ATP-binding protein [Actinacidiphila acididurans]
MAEENTFRWRRLLKFRRAGRAHRPVAPVPAPAVASDGSAGLEAGPDEPAEPAEPPGSTQSAEPTQPADLAAASAEPGGPAGPAGPAGSWSSGTSGTAPGAGRAPRGHHSAADAAVFYCELPHRPASVRAARHAAEAVLTSWGLSQEAVYDVMLVVSELVTNAVEHALPPVAVRLRLADPDADNPVVHVHVYVSDGGPAPSPGSWAASCQTDEHGRGRQVITALARSTGARGTDDSAGHWAVLDAA